MPSLVLGFHSPWERVYSKPLSLHAFKAFGCACYPYLRPFNQNKLQPRSKPCVFLGYPPLSKGYYALIQPLTEYTLLVMFCLMSLSFLLLMILASLILIFLSPHLYLTGFLNLHKLLMSLFILLLLSLLLSPHLLISHLLFFLLFFLH